MGFFKKIFSESKDYNKIANAVINVKVLLDEVEYGRQFDTSKYLIAAWTCRVGVIDVIERNSWSMTNQLFIPFNGHQTKMTLNEAYLMSIGRLTMKVGEIDDEVKEVVLSILDKKEWFYKIDSQVSDEKKKIFQ